MKQKTKKAARKRFTFSAHGKVQYRTTHQAHFNAKDSGKDTRRKHRDKTISANDLQRIHDLIPYQE